MESAALIGAARRRAGLTQAELARRAGTSQPVVSAYERGHRQPEIDTLARLVEAAGMRLRLVVDAGSDGVPPARSNEERAQRLVDVLGLADAIPHRPRPRRLDAPRMESR